MGRNRGKYSEQISAFIDRKEVGDTFTYNELLAAVHITVTEIKESSDEYKLFSGIFSKHPYCKTGVITKTQSGYHRHSMGKSDTKFMKAKNVI